MLHAHGILATYEAFLFLVEAGAAAACWLF